MVVSHSLPHDQKVKDTKGTWDSKLFVNLKLVVNNNLVVC